MKVEVNFPHRIEVNDYHDFNYVQEHLQRAFPKNTIKVKEIGCIGKYIGIIYLDRMNRASKTLENKLKKEVRDFERQNTH